MEKWVVIPTYNEKGNIVRLIGEILKQDPELEMVVVDDDSPDGTALAVAELAQTCTQVHLLVRRGMKGRGPAGVEGMKYALSQGAKYVIEMDADFSHHPQYIPDLFREINNYDVVLGSRFVPGGKNFRKGLIRNAVTTFANFYIRHSLKLNIQDCTSGYRCFRREVLESIGLDNTISLGPSIVQELLYKSVLLGYRVKEIPIVFVDRYRGISSFNFRIALQGFIMVLILQFLFSQLRRINPVELKTDVYQRGRKISMVTTNALRSPRQRE